MCGINLIVDKHKHLPPAKGSPSPISSMLESNLHRGPDHQEALSIDGKHWRFFLGSNRLKIIGRENEANQPFSEENRQYYLLYNGAIYNFYELRNELLSAGKKFRTHSDTEVLSKMLVGKQQNAFAHLNGMFAFIHFDVQNERLLFARDKQGMKPLFYYEDENYFIASSELSGILASGLVEKPLHTSQISHYLQYKYAASPATFFESIFEWKPGHYGTISPHTSLYIEPFKKTDPAKIVLDRGDQLLEKTESLLSDAVMRHLIADVPCGLFLSGGVDSTLLLALIQKLGAHPVDTFTIVTENNGKSFGTSDAKYARMAAKQYGQYHYEVPVNADILDDIEEFVSFLDQPIADSASLLTFILSREAKKKVGVVLSGAGADELFGGYNRHAAYYHYLKNYAFYLNIKPFLNASAKFLPTGFHHPLRSYFRLLKKFGENLNSDPRQTFLNFTASSYFSDDQLSDDATEFSENFVEQHLSFALHHDLSHYLVSDILALNDRMSMAHSLEMRMPYLDDEVIRFAQELPATFKLKNGKKWILKSLLNRLGGDKYTRRKEGFGLPFGAWLHNDHAYNKIRPYLEDEQLPVYQFVAYGKVQKLLEEHRRKQEDNSAMLWSLLTLSAWLVKSGSLQTAY